MTDIDIADDTFFAVPPQRLAPIVADSSRWASWWPGLTLAVYRDRGLKGQQWRVSGQWHGTAEIWLEPMADGVVLHCFLRVDLVDRSVSPRDERRYRAAFVRSWKRSAWALKDELEGGRPPGEPPVSCSSGLRDLPIEPV